MAPYDAAEGCSDLKFELNPSAPEFFPCGPPSWLLPPQQQPDQEQQQQAAGADRAGAKCRGGASRRSRKNSSCEVSSPSWGPAAAGARPEDTGSSAPDSPPGLCPLPDEVAILAEAAGSPMNSPTLTSSAPYKGSRLPGRRCTSSVEAPGQVATLVVKNLALDLEKDSILRYLKDRNVEPTEVELHTDALGAFRGTAFVRYGHPDDARAALDKLGACVELGGRRARIEIQKSKSLIGRRSLEAELPHEELGIVRAQIEGFLWDPSLTEMRLPPAFNVQQRKYAHSLAERHSLSHLTQQGETGEKFVLLSKARRFQQQDSTPTLRTRTKAYSMNVDESTMAMAGCRKKKVRSSSGSFMLHYSDYSPASAPTPNMYSPNLDAIPDDMLLPGPFLPLLPPGLELSGGHMAPPPGLSWTPYDNETAWLDDFKLVEQGTSIFELAMAEADEENTADNADKFSEKSTACSNEDESSPQKRTVSDMSPQSNEDLKVCARPTDDACGRADLVEALQLALREKVPCGGP